MMEQNKNEYKGISSPDNSLFTTVCEALSQNPHCTNKSKEVIKTLAKEAIKKECFNDEIWLKEKLDEYDNLGEKKFLKIHRQEEKDSSEKEKEFESAFLDLKPSNRQIISSQEELQQILNDHKMWIKSVLNPAEKIKGGRANLKGQDLREYDLSQANLSCADLSFTNLSGLDLSSVNLRGANLTGACMQGCELKGAKLKNTELKGADLLNTLISPQTFEEADFSEVINIKKPQKDLLQQINLEAEIKEEVTKKQKKQTKEKAHPLLDELLI